MASEPTPLIGICDGLETAAVGGSSGADYLEVSVQGFLDAANEDPVTFEADLTRECNFINILAEGAEIVAACNQPAVGLVADTCHMGFNGEGPEDVRHIAEILHHFHVADYPSRRYPGADGQEYARWFEVLREVNHTGAVSAECHWDDINVDAGRAMDNLRRDLAAGYGWGRAA